MSATAGCLGSLSRLGSLGRGPNPSGSPSEPERLAPRFAGHRGHQGDLGHPGHPGHLFAVRGATPAEADAIHALITSHLAEGHLLPRRREEIAVHASRFVVALDGDRLVGCADLAPLSRSVAEVRSLVVSEGARSLGLGRRMVDELTRRAAEAGFEKLCAFTHSPAYFVEIGFSIVPHVWLPEKIETDCRMCPHFRACGQYAVMLPLMRGYGDVPLAALHG